MIINFNTGGSGGGVTEERVKELIAEYGAPILVEYDDIDTELGKEIYANPEKYVIGFPDESNLFGVFRVKNEETVEYEFIRIKRHSSTILNNFNIDNGYISIHADGTKAYGKREFSNFIPIYYDEYNPEDYEEIENHAQDYVIIKDNACILRYAFYNAGFGLVYFGVEVKLGVTYYTFVEITSEGIRTVMDMPISPMVYEYSAITSGISEFICSKPENFSIEDGGKIYQFAHKTSSGASYYYTDMMFAPEDNFIVLDKNEISLYYNPATSAYTKDLVENRQVVPLGSSGGGKKQLIIGSASTQDLVGFYNRVVELRQEEEINQVHIFDEYDIRYFFQEGMNSDCQNVLMSSVAFYRNEVTLRGESSAVLESSAKGIRQYAVIIKINASGNTTISKDMYSTVLDVRVGSNSAITFNSAFYGNYWDRLIQGNCPVSVHGNTNWTTTDCHLWKSVNDNKIYLYCRFHNPADDELWEAKWEFKNNAAPIFMRQV